MSEAPGRSTRDDGTPSVNAEEMFSDNDKALLDWLTRLNTFMPHRLHSPSTLDVSIQGEVIVLRLGRTVLNRRQAQLLEEELPPPSKYGIQIWMGEKFYGFLPAKLNPL